MRIGTFVGVPVFIGWTWLILAAFIIWSSGSSYTRIYPELGTLGYAAGLAVAVGLLASVLVHEAAHALSARAFGLRVRRIVADLMGGHTAFEGPTTPLSQGLTALSGPLANLLLAAGLYGIGLVLSDGIGASIVLRLAFLNVLLGIFNLLPGLPLDGGQVLMALLWRLTRSPHRASIMAGWSGRVVAILTVVVLVVIPLATGAQPDLVLVFLAVLVASFLWRGASASIAVGRARQRISTTPLDQVMRPVVLVQAHAPIETWWRGAQQVYVTTDPASGAPNGIVRADALGTVPQEQWGSVPAAAVSGAAPSRWIYEFDARPSLEDVIALMMRDQAEVMLIVESRQVTGIVFGADAMGVLQ